MNDDQTGYVHTGTQQMGPVFDHGALVMGQHHPPMVNCPPKDVGVGGSQQPGFLAIHQVDSPTEPDYAIQQWSVATLVGKKG